MRDITGIFFAARELHPREITGRRIIEVGSYNVNASIRRIWETWGPAKYASAPQTISTRGPEIISTPMGKNHHQRGEASMTQGVLGFKKESQGF